MLLKYSLLLLGLVVGIQSKEICNFEKNFCNWAHLYECQFIHETRKPLAGEKGYLYLSENTCEKAGISFMTENYLHKFQLHYFMNGTGRGMLAISADYFYSGPKYLWSCDINQGPHWNKADIFIKDEGTFDFMIRINIEATVSGQMTVAIGNISPNYSGHIMSKCPSPRLTHEPTTRLTHKLTTLKTITARRPITSALTTTAITKTSSNFITSSAHQETRYFTERAAVTNQGGRKTTEHYLGTSYISTALMQTSKQGDQKDITAIPAVTITARNTTTSQQRSTPLQDVTTLKSGSDEINGETAGKAKQQRSAKSKHGAIIGGTVFAIAFVIVAVVIGIFMYRGKNRKWNIQSSPVKGFKNQLYL